MGHTQAEQRMVVKFFLVIFECKEGFTPRYSNSILSSTRLKMFSKFLRFAVDVVAWSSLL